jgi:hypothetical protein
MAVDLRDGMRLGKAIEYLLWSKNIKQIIMETSSESASSGSNTPLKSKNQPSNKTKKTPTLKGSVSLSPSSSSSFSSLSPSSFPQPYLLSLCSRMKLLEGGITHIKHNNSVLLGAMERLMYTGLIGSGTKGLLSPTVSNLNILKWIQPLDLETGHRQKTIAAGRFLYRLVNL